MQISSSKRRGAVIFIFITMMLDMIALGMIAPVFPALVKSFAGTAGNTSFVLGYFGVAFATLQFFASPFLGILSDRFGRRPIVLLSNLATAIDYVVMALAPTLGWLFVGRVVSGAATASFAVASAYIADTTTPEKRSAGYGMIGAAFGIGFILGPLLGGVLGTFGPRVPFWVAAGLSLANFAYGTFILPESLKPENRIARIDYKRANPLGALTLLRSHHELLGLTWVMFLGELAHESLPYLWIIYCIAVFHWNALQLGLSLALVGVVSVLSQTTLVQPMVKRFGERRLLVFGIAVTVLTYMMFGTPNGWVFLLALPVSAFALYDPPMQSLMSRRVAANEQGALQGALGSVRGLTMILGPAIFLGIFSLFVGPWKTAHLPGAPWFLAATMMIGALLLAIRVTNREDDVVLPTSPDLLSVNTLE